MVGIVILYMNDELYLSPALDSLILTIDYPCEIMFRGIQSFDGSGSVINNFVLASKANPFIHNIIQTSTFEKESLVVSLNYCFDYLLKMNNIEYLAWFHPDMIATPNWLSKLVELNNKLSGGKTSSHNPLYGRKKTDYWIGHEQCYIIDRSCVEKIGLLDYRYVGIGGFEDWDFNNKAIENGFPVCVSGDSVVLHFGMRTRRLTNHTLEEKYNYQLYKKLWGNPSGKKPVWSWSGYFKPEG